MRETGRVRRRQAVGDLHDQIEQFSRRIHRCDRRAVDKLHHEVTAAVG